MTDEMLNFSRDRKAYYNVTDRERIRGFSSLNLLCHVREKEIELKLRS